MPALGVAAALAIATGSTAACGSEPIGTGGDAEAAGAVVRAAFAEPQRLCDELATEPFVQELGGDEECASQAAAVAPPEGRRAEGAGFTLGEVTLEDGGATVQVETPDFGRYVVHLVDVDGAFRIDAVDPPATFSPDQHG